MVSLLLPLALMATDPPRPGCHYDLEAELASDFVTFDQTEGKGWRPLYDAKCYVAAAELIGAWKAQHAGSFDPANRREQHFLRTLIWHEAQMWAFAQRNDMALPLFETTYREGGMGTPWNLYVDGTLAFLGRDKDGLEAAMTKLAAVPKPPGWDNAVDAEGNPVSMPWPQNLDVLQGLSRCWDDPYSVAYRCRELPAPPPQAASNS